MSCNFSLVKRQFFAIVVRKLCSSSSRRLFHCSAYQVSRIEVGKGRFSVVPTIDTNDAESETYNGVLTSHTNKSLEEYHGNEECSEYELSGVTKSEHIPVMVEKVLAALRPKKNQLIVDMTFGAGGHARHILQRAPGVQYLASDRDPVAFKKAVELARSLSNGNITPLLSKFSELPVHFEQLGIQKGTVDGFLMDLGASSMQFDSSARGFSLSKDGPLDMRMDGSRFTNSATAADVVNTLEPSELSLILKKYGEEKKAVHIAQALVDARYAFGNFTRTKQLADVIQSVFDSSFHHDKLHHHAHVATKSFQALRIFVNDELNEINNGLQVVRHYLKPGGRCVAISFHSLEDRIVKRHFHDIDMDEAFNQSAQDHFRNVHIELEMEEVKDKFLTSAWKPISRKVTEASEAEVAANPRARSARLRAAVRTEVP